MNDKAKLHNSEYSEDSEKRVSRAAAISYDPDAIGVPVLAAFGEGHLAEKIVEIAKESGVPVMPDPSLASMLSKISVGDEISPEMYEAVAKVLAFVSEVDRRYGSVSVQR
jgi:flagellar biosynthesis protein